MGVQQSSLHFEKLNGVMQNQSGYQIKYKVTRPNNEQLPSGKLVQTLNESGQQLGQQKILEDEQGFLYAGLVSPYSTKYYSFSQIQNTYKFSVYALKLNNQSVYQIVPLQKQLNISSQKSICLRITPQLKVIHLNQQEIQQLHFRKSLEAQIIKISKIVKTPQLSHRLVSMFNKTYPQKVQLLYRASEQQFDMKPFYQLHGNKQNIVLICKTDKGKIIGAYSRMALIPVQQNEYDQKGWTSIYDPSNSTFIFSLTSYDIFRLKQSQVGVYYNKDQEQICFGKDELRISNFSNKNQCLTQNINSNYENHNYNNDTDSYRLLNGNDTPQFKTQEWEIWQLFFKLQQTNILLTEQNISTLIDVA